MAAKIKVIGAGLAGCEAAWAAANRGIEVELIEMKPQKHSPAHKSDLFAELVCSNSLRSDSVTNAVGLLKEQIYNSYPNVEVEAGPIVSISDGADGIPVKSLVVGIEPVQAGSGDPSPDNIRPITGWTGTSVNANGTEIPISWEREAGTVYGGALDVTNGILTVDRKRVVYDGTNATWRMYTVSGVIRMQTQVADMLNVGGITYNGEYVVIGNIGKTQIPDAIGVIRNYQQRLWYYPPTGIDTVESFNSWLAENNLEVVYMLADPITYQLTPTEVKSLLGQNNIYADTGDTSVEYRADIQRYIQKMLLQ